MTDANVTALLFIAVCMAIGIVWIPDHCGRDCPTCRPKPTRKH